MSRCRAEPGCSLDASWISGQSSPVTALIGFRDLNLSGLFCAAIHTGALVALPLGATGLMGLINWKHAGARPWKPAYRGVEIFTQAGSLQLARPVELALSQGTRITLLSAPATPPVKASYVPGWGKGSSTRTVGSAGPFGGSVVVQVSR